MRFNPNQLGYRPGQGGSGMQKPGMLSKIAAFVVTALLAGMALMFSILLFAVAITVGLFIWAYVWWKMRGLRKRMEKQMAENGEAGMWRQHRRPSGSDVLEGEVIREVHEPDERDRQR